MWAAAKGKVDVVQELLKHGANVNAQGKWGNAALMIAAVKGHLQVVQELLGAGANIEAQNNAGNTALIWAIHRHQEAVSVAIIKKQTGKNFLLVGSCKI